MRLYHVVKNLRMTNLLFRLDACVFSLTLKWPMATLSQNQSLQSLQIPSTKGSKPPANVTMT